MNKVPKKKGDYTIPSSAEALECVDVQLHSPLPHMPSQRAD